MMNGKYSVNTVTEAQKIAVDFRENVQNIINAYSDDSERGGDLLYGALMQAANAWKFILDNTPVEIRTSTAMDYLDRIYEGVKYLEENFDERLVGGQRWDINDVAGLSKDLFYI